MQFEISDPAALVFSQSFYQAIADGLPVDMAMVDARRAMFAAGHEVEWATPVLYLRSRDGRVFAMSQASHAERQARADAQGQADSRGTPGTRSSKSTNDEQSSSGAWPELEPLPASREPALRSFVSEQDTEVEFVNMRATEVVIYWLNYEGKRILYQRLPPGARYVQPTFVTHPWVIATTDNHALMIIQPAPERARITIR
jgi:hypothetical protein